MTFLKRTFIVLVFLWLSGFLGFVLYIQYYPRIISNSTDAVVVLTGGSNRVEKGLEIMTHLNCANLFISGVNPSVSKQDILKRVEDNNNIGNCDFELGYEAQNTQQNAEEVIGWLKKKNLSSIVLVTAYYHLPRSLLEFRALNPGLKIQAYAVFPDAVQSNSIQALFYRSWLLFKEYHKLVVAWLRIKVLKI